MLYLRESLTRGFKSRFFAKSLDGAVVHLSRLYGKAVRSVVFGRGFVEYSLDNPQGVLEIYEVSFSEGLIKTIVYDPTSLKSLGELRELPQNLSSGFSLVDRVAGELGGYRRYWSRVLCGLQDFATSFYVVDAMARGAVGQALYGRVKELLQESSREYVGFALAALVTALLNRGFKIEETREGFCFSAMEAEPVSWKGARVTLSDGESRLVLVTERRLGVANPDIAVDLIGQLVLFECKTGPPKTWLPKAVKQAKVYKSIGPAFLLTPNQLGEQEYRLLSEHYYAAVECSPTSSDSCVDELGRLLSTVLRL